MVFLSRTKELRNEARVRVTAARRDSSDGPPRTEVHVLGGPGFSDLALASHNVACAKGQKTVTVAMVQRIL